MAAGQGEGFGGRDIAKDQEDGVRWRVVGTEELLHVGEGGGIEIGEIAVKIMGIGPIAESDGRHIEPGKSAVGLIEDVDADFLFDDIALVAKVFIVNFEGAHAVGFKPQDAFEGVRGHRFVIISDVVMGGPVQDAARGIDELDVHHLAGMLGALKHHVLKKMREAAAAAGLEAKSDIVVDADGRDRRGAVGGDDHAEAIFQRGALDGNVQGIQRLSLVLGWVA